MHCLIIPSNLQNQWQIAHLDPTYSSPAKRYILLCNTAQTVCEIKGCVISHGNNKQTWPLSRAKPPKPLLLQGGGYGC
jgi:hypothetical protein